ncbi:MAG: TIGR04084 family radical SAM/SPASM domain-containing protein [Thermoplasmata archaeon]
MLYLVTTTGKCNLKCKYCGGSFDERAVPYSIKYDIEKIVKIINNDDEATIVYYGGEPLLNGKFIRDLNSRINAKRIGIQTNGILVKNYDSEFWKKFDFVLLSIDGDKERTDKNRGNGVYEKVISSAKYLKSLNLEIIGRMTITSESDIYNDVMHLVNLKIFDKIHWQLDVVWDNRWDLKNYADKSYLPGIRKLMDEFIYSIKLKKMLKIVPFLGILSAHFFKPFQHFPCGAGKKSITINTDGRVFACPIAPDYDWNNIGTLDKYKEIEKPKCDNCKYFRYCGGRCLFSYMEKYWGEDGFDEICYVTKKTIDIVLERVEELESLSEEGIFDLKELYYDPTLDSTEIIP